MGTISSSTFTWIDLSLDLPLLESNTRTTKFDTVPPDDSEAVEVKVEDVGEKSKLGQSERGVGSS